MSFVTRIVPLSAAELDFLLRPENQDLHEAYGDGLAALHGLAARYAGFWYFVTEPDEGDAIASVENSADSLAPAPALAARMRANLAFVKAFGQAAAREGLTDEVRSAGTELMHALVDESEALYGRGGNQLAAPRAAAG
jgi:hypothetical protein